MKILIALFQKIFFEILTAAFNKNYQEATQRLDDHLREEQVVHY